MVRNMNKRVLIIEDDEDIQEYYEIVLSHLNIEFLKAGNGKEALAIINSEKNIDLILLDVVMPVMDGEIFIKKLKKELKTNIPIIPCSCDDTSINRLKEIDDNFSDIFIKSQGAKHLKNIVKKALNL
jgi:CheY-like chemotaxis protein